ARGCVALAMSRTRLTTQKAGGAWGGDGAGRQAGTSHFVPTTEQRYTSVVGVSVISPALAAAKTSVSEVSWVGATPMLKVICTSCQSGLNPSPWIASSTLTNDPPPGSCPMQASH